MKRWIHATTSEPKSFKGWSLKELKFYYNDHIDPDEFPTFFHWVMWLRDNNLF